MGDRFEMQDEVLAAAGASLVVASVTMAESARRAPSDEMRSLSGIGERVGSFLSGIEVARRSLADAARTAGAEIAGAMQQSQELDAQIAQSLPPGFAVGRGSR